MAAQEERTSSLIPTRDALALEAAELRKFTPTKPLAEIKDEITTEVAARRKKEGEVRRVKEKITTINARVRQLASQKRAPLPAEMQSAVKTLGSVEITAQQSGLLTKQMAESGAQQGLTPFVICVSSRIYLGQIASRLQGHQTVCAGGCCCCCCC